MGTNTTGLLPPFTKGDPRINRRGRLDVARGFVQYVDLLRKYLKMKPGKLRTLLSGVPIGQRNDRPVMEYMAALQVQRAVADKNPHVLENLLDRVWGKALDRQEHTINGGLPFEVTVRVVDKAGEPMAGPDVPPQEGANGDSTLPEAV